MTKKLSELIPEFFTDDNFATQIYTGSEFGCRCGCQGKYFDRNSKGYSRARNKARKLDPEITLLSTDEINALDVSEWNEIRGFAPQNLDWIDIYFPDTRKTITIIHLD